MKKYNKTYLFSNIFPHYDEPLWTTLINNIKGLEIGFDSNDNRGIKLVDIDSYEPDLKNRFFQIKNFWIMNKHLVFQLGVIRRCILNNTVNNIFLGDSKIISTWISIIISKIKGSNVILWTHGIYGNEGKLKLFVRKIFYRLADKLILYERRAKAKMIELGFDKNNLYVIFNSLNYEKQRILYERFNLNQENNNFSFFKNNSLPVLIFIGRLTEVKKIDLLIKAVKKINKKNDIVNLLIIGDGEQRNYLEKISKKYLDNTIYFFGECNDEEITGKFIFYSSLCVSPGNVGLTAIHSLSYGTPVLTHNNFNNQMPEVESIQPGFNGYFFEENNLDDLIKKILYHLKTQKISKNDCRRVVDMYYNPKYQLSVFEKLINNINPEL